jgi:hypothetical protein
MTGGLPGRVGEHLYRVLGPPAEQPGVRPAGGRFHSVLQGSQAASDRRAAVVVCQPAIPQCPFQRLLVVAGHRGERSHLIASQRACPGDDLLHRVSARAGGRPARARPVVYKRESQRVADAAVPRRCRALPLARLAGLGG